MTKLKQREITKLIKAARAAGLPVSRVAADGAGRVMVFTHSSDAVRLTNEWDVVV